MRHKIPALLVGLVLISALGGCGGRDFETELINFRDRSRAQLDVMKKQNELLNRKLNDMNARLDKLQESNDRLSAELTSYVTRPEEVKLEIITEVNTRFSAAAKNQEDFFTQVNTAFDDRTTATQDTLNTKMAAMEADLLDHSAFVKFVATAQDSINRVFASRFDSRPWYQSFMGKWEDRERTRASGNP
jgi:chromosome segregation ATPase